MGRQYYLDDGGRQTLLGDLRRRISRRFVLGGTLATILGSPFPAFSGARAERRIVLLGDCLFTAALAQGSEDLAKLRPWLENAAVTIGNFEGTLAYVDAWPTLVFPGGKTICGGMNVRGDDNVIADLRRLRIGMVSTGNNHALDWGISGLLATLRKLDAAGIRHAGTGIDLAAARAPAYCDTSIGRVGLVSFTSTFWSGALASRPNGSTPGRPGVSPLRFSKSDEASTATWPNPDDLADIVASVRTAAGHADHVVVSCHTHERPDDIPPDFLREVAYACIDSGAGIFFSHGPHKLRGMEAYRGKPIFYSLGAFIFRNHASYPLPSELFENCQLRSRDPKDYYARIEADFDDDLPFWQSALVSFSPAENKACLVPVLLRHAANGNYGTPTLAAGADADSIFDRIAHLSKPYGVEMSIKNGVGEWQL